MPQEILFKPLRVVQVAGGDDELVLADAAFGQLLFQTMQVVVAYGAWLAQFHAELAFVDIIDQFRAVPLAVTELEGEVIWLAQVSGVLDLDGLLGVAFHTDAFASASLYPLLVGREADCGDSLEDIQALRLLNDDATM